MARLIVLFLFYLFLSPVCAEPVHYRVISWNVENLFDCQHDTLKNDYEFLPKGERQWSWGRYWKKIDDICRVIMGIGETQAPTLVGLCEVENDSVMTALVQRSSLRTIGYKYVITDSPDQRGIDVALMYLPSRFRLQGYESRRVPSEKHGLRPTRDILHAWGQIDGGDTLHVVVCHLPSKAGGKDNDRNRRLAVETLLQLTDSLLSGNPDCQLLVMGDFNGPLSEKTLSPIVQQTALVELTPTERSKSCGTYRFQGTWEWLDHILASPTLARKAVALAQLYSQLWMQRKMNDGTWYPNRTYLGKNYNGGVSDHVPVYIDLRAPSDSP